MDSNTWLMLGVFVIGMVALIGFFITKTRGFGRYATSTFLLLLAVVIAGLLYSSGKLDGSILANILFAVIGFAGGLFTSKECPSHLTARLGRTCKVPPIDANRWQQALPPNTSAIQTT